jgi:uncharacterized protein
MSRFCEKICKTPLKTSFLSEALMLINVEDPQKGKKIHLAFTEAVPMPDGIASATDASLDLSFEGSLAYDGKRHLLTGDVKTSINALCDFCLQPFSMELAYSMEEFYSTELVPDSEDEVWVFDGNAIDLSEAMRVNLILNLPLAFSCKPGCKGLCPRCGQDLNAKDCGCPKRLDDPRFSILKDFE